MNTLEMMQINEGYIVEDAKMPKDMQHKARKLCFEYNHLDVDKIKRKKEILHELFGECSDLTFVEANFQCDYGINIHTKGLTVINFNCVILDTSPVYFGENCFIAPNVVISCSGHPLDSEERNSGYLVSKPITIGDNVWIGANVTIRGGVKIGNNSVIGAGSVVTRDIPEGVVAFGNPCRPIRKITEKDRILLNDSLNGNH